MKLVLKNVIKDEEVEVKVGFSWTALMFGAATPLWRKDFKWCVIFLAGTGATSGVAHFIFPFIYNRYYIKDLLQAGYKVKEVIDGDIKAAEKELGFSL